MQEEDAIIKIVTHLSNLTRAASRSDAENYIDLKGNLKDVCALTNIAIFGRRGSGKSMLLLKMENENETRQIINVHIDCELYKKYTYPNLLIKILVNLIKEINDSEDKSSFSSKIKKLFHRKSINIGSLIDELIKKNEEDDKYTKHIAEKSEQENTNNMGASASINIPTTGTDATSSLGREQKETAMIEAAYDTVIDKEKYLERKLDDFRKIIKETINNKGYEAVVIVLDDFYHLDRRSQPKIIDFVHRICKGQKAYFKIASIRQRTDIYSREKEGTPIGVQPGHDVKEIDLDYTLEDFDSTKIFLRKLLDNMFKEGHLKYESYINERAIDRLIWCSGGVPRDFLNILKEALNEFLSTHKKIKVRSINKATARYYQQKLAELKTEYSSYNEYEKEYCNLLDFCLVKHKKTAFLVNPEDIDSKYKFINDLSDFRLIHLISKTTTSKNDPGKNYYAYILDVGSYANKIDIKKTGERIKEINILKRDLTKKDILPEIRSQAPILENISSTPPRLL